LLVDVYHEFSHPFEMTEAMVKALKQCAHFWPSTNIRCRCRSIRICMWHARPVFA